MTKSILFHIPISHPNPFDYKKQKTKNKKKIASLTASDVELSSCASPLFTFTNLSH